MNRLTFKPGTDSLSLMCDCYDSPKDSSYDISVGVERVIFFPLFFDDSLNFDR
jgi:hypothetical protein